MELILLYILIVIAPSIYLAGLNNVIGFVVGVAAHGTFRRRPLSVLAVAASIGAVMVALSRMDLIFFGRFGFYFGLLVYGWFYYNNAEDSGRSSSPWLRSSWIWRALRVLYGHRFVDTNGAIQQAIDAKRPVLHVAHPHGIYVLGPTMTFIVPPFWPHVYVGSLWIIFALPGLRELALAGGCVSLKPEVIEQLLSSGRNVAVVPEGTRAHAPRLTASDPPREGFIKMAYEMDASIMLIETPREMDTYWVWEPLFLDKLRMATLKRWRYAFPTFFWTRLPPAQGLSTFAAFVGPPQIINKNGDKESLDTFATRIRENRTT